MKAYRRTEYHAEYVKKYAHRVSHTVLARQMGISVDTLTRHYADELNESFEKKVLPITGMLHSQAAKGDRTSQIVIARNFAGWNNRFYEKENDGPAEPQKAFAVDPKLLAELSDEEFALYERLCAKLPNGSEGSDPGPEGDGGSEADQGGQ